MHGVAMAVAMAVAVGRCRGAGVAILSACSQQYAPLLGAVRRRGCERSGNRGEAPFLDVGLDEHEAGLAEVDVDDTGTVCADGREEVMRLEPVRNVL